MEERKIVMDQDYIWGCVEFTNGHKAIAVVGEQDGRGYYIQLNGTSVSSVVGFREGNENLRFDAWIDQMEFSKKDISVLKGHRYLQEFGRTLRHPVITDISTKSLL